ncbi:MAG TPA: nuclear transport factor 2 family protein [Thermoleophilaceae bacterium]|nr:nuclear transport factor 2 family protein [Thermoleophilaceae bacterium]
MSDNVELVRRLWSAFERGGIEAVLEIVDPDVKWEPYGGGGAVYHGHQGLRAYFDERRARGEEADGRLYSAFAKGDFVVARGEVQIRSEHGVVTMQPGWLYEFRDGRLIRFRGFPTQEVALRAAGLAPQDASAVVRDLIDAFNKRQPERMAELVSDDCEWRSLAGKQIYVGPAGVREYVQENFGSATSVSVAEYTLRDAGDSILVSGSLNVVEASGGIAQRQVHWLMTIADGKITRAQSFIRREDATAAAEAAARAAAG